MKLLRLTSLLALCAASNAFAGTAPVTSAKNPASAPVDPAPSALFDSIGGTVDVGYDSRYYYRGLWFADNIVWTSLNISVPLTEKLSWGLGATYISTVETPFGIGAPGSFDYSEIDLLTSLNYNAGWAKFGVQYLHYFYPDTYSGTTSLGPNFPTDEFGIKGAGELGITAAIPIGAANLSLGYFYDFRVGGSYFQAGLDYTYAVNDWLSIVPAITTGYGIDYYTGSALGLSPSSGFTHILTSLSAPMKLTKTVTLTPYVAWNHSLATRENLNLTTWNEVFGGVKLSLAF